VRIGDLPLTVVGVTPQGFMGFSLLVEPDITVPLPVLTHLMGVSVAEFEAGTVAPIRIIGRLRDGVTIEQARAEALALWPAIREAALPASYTGPQRDRFLATRVDVKPAGKGLETRLRARYTQPLMIILGIAGLVLVIACVNLASMMLSRTATRIHEIGVRLALGADWWRLARQLIVEGLLLSIGGAVLGMAFAYWSSFAIVSVIFRDYLVPAGLNVAPDGRVLAFTAIVAVGVGILFSLAPAWKATRASALAALQHSTRTSTGTGRAGRWLVASQVALSLVLLTNAGLLIRTLQEIRAVPSGLLSDDVFVTFPGPPQGAYPPGDNDVYYPQVIGRLMALPGMQSVSVSLAKPAGGGSSQTTPVAGIAESDLLAHGVGTIRTAVSPRFFETLGIAMVSGRDFSFGDSSKARRVAIVSRSLGRRLFGDGLAIGQRIRVGIKPADQDVEVVGVASDARVYDLTNANPYAVYVPALQDPDADWKCFVFRGRGVPAPDVRRAVESLGREVLGATNSLSYITGRTLLQERMTAALAGFFAALALLLAAVGLYGLMAYTVAQRRREIGLRIALGAEPRRVMADVVRDGVSVALAGIGVGFAGALAAVQLVRSLLFGVAPHDPLTLAAAPASLLAVTVLACLAPAARAARVDPMISLRSE
jgi:predicted permease